MGVLITQTTRIYGNQLDEFICSTNSGAIALLVLMLCFNTIYPRASPWRAAWGGSSTIFGTWYGVFQALHIGLRFFPDAMRELYRSSFVQPKHVWYNSYLFNHDNDSDSHNRETLSANSQWSRLVVGTAFVLTVKLVSKYGATALLMWLSRKGFIQPRKGEDRDVLGQIVPLKQSYGVEVSMRLVSYVCVGFSSVLGCAFVWHRWRW
jgi:hypothetical protein